MEPERTWDGPIHGSLGILADDGVNAQCHICGEFFGNLGGHVSQAHGISPQDYKEMFGLNAKTGLLGPALKEVRRLQGEARRDTDSFAAFTQAGARARAALTPEQRSRRGRRLRLQQRIDPNVRAAHLAALERANEVVRQLKAAGTYKPAGWGDRDPREIAARGRQRLKELLTDPEWRAEFARKVSEARGGRLTVTCVVCGSEFREPHSHRNRRTCSPECLVELRRRQSASRQAANAEDRGRRLEQGVALLKLRGERGMSVAKLAALSGISMTHISRIERGLNVPSDLALSRLESVLTAPASGLNGNTHGHEPLSTAPPIELTDRTP